MSEIAVEPSHYTNAATRGMPHEAGPERCWCLDSDAVLRAEIERRDIAIEAAHKEHADLRSTVERLTLENQLKDAVVEAARAYVACGDHPSSVRTWGILCISIAALDAAQQPRGTE